MQTDQYFVIVSGLTKRIEPLLHGRRDEALEETDSGWQFSGLVDSAGEIADAEVWSVDELINYDASIAGILDAPVGAVARRSSSAEPWTLEI